MGQKVLQIFQANYLDHLLTDAADAADAKRFPWFSLFDQGYSCNQ